MNIQSFSLPLVAILRGLAPSEARDVGAVLSEAGFRLLEVPLNRPGAVESIKALVDMKMSDTVIGGGTMLTVADVDAVAAAGGRLFVSPNCNPKVIAHAREVGMLCLPGVATPTEAFAALDAGAHALKLFPSEAVGMQGMRAIKTVLPAGTPLWPVGGVTPESMGAWCAAGANGFGIGSALYSPGVSLEQLAQRAKSFVDAWKAAQAVR